tara:strand:- start:74 stop:1276 length:1203 start_codon:yes stop_codon:yes gene_type:complete
MAGRYKAYSEHQESGVEWLGEIPKNWKVKRLKHLCRVKTGAKDTQDSIEFGEYPFFVRSQTVERISSYSADCEAILTAGDGVGVGKVFHHYKGKFDYHQRVYMLSSFHGITGRFLFYYLSNNFHKVALDGNAKSTVDSLRLPQFLNFEFSLPSLSEQKQIARFLDHETGKIDLLIEKQHALIALLKEKRQAVVHSAIQHPETQKCRLENCSEIISRPIHRLDDVEYTAVGLYNRGRGIFHKDTTLGRDLGDSYFFHLEAGDLIFSGQFAWEGAVALTRECERGCIASHRYPVIRGKSGMVDTAYLWAFFASQTGDFLLNENSRGAAGRNRPLNMNSLSKEMIPVPPLSAQHEVARLVYAERKLEELIGEPIQLLQERRTALISAAVTGKIDVRDWTAPEA